MLLDSRHQRSPSVRLRLEERVPPAHLLVAALLHVLPVQRLLLAATVLAQCQPADHLLALHVASVVHGRHERDVGELEQRHLEDERLLEHGVGMSAPHRRLAARDLLTHGVQQSQLHVRIYKEDTLDKDELTLKPTHMRTVTTFVLACCRC